MYQALFGPADMMGLQRSYTLPFGKGTSVHHSKLSSMEISVTRKVREKKPYKFNFWWNILKTVIIFNIIITNNC